MARLEGARIGLNRIAGAPAPRLLVLGVARDHRRRLPHVWRILDSLRALARGSDAAMLGGVHVGDGRRPFRIGTNVHPTAESGRMLPKLLPTATYGTVVPKQAIENIHLDDPSR